MLIQMPAKWQSKSGFHVVDELPRTPGGGIDSWSLLPCPCVCPSRPVPSPHRVVVLCGPRANSRTAMWQCESTYRLLPGGVTLLVMLCDPLRITTSIDPAYIFFADVSHSYCTRDVHWLDLSLCIYVHIYIMHPCPSLPQSTYSELHTYSWMIGVVFTTRFIYTDEARMQVAASVIWKKLYIKRLFIIWFYIQFFLQKYTTTALGNPSCSGTHVGRGCELSVA